MSEPIVLRVGPKSVHLAPPRSAAARVDLLSAVAGADGAASLRLLAAAVGLSWPRAPGAPRARYNGRDLHLYGGAVLDHVIEHGGTLDALTAAGVALLEVIAADGMPGVVQPLDGSDPFGSEPGVV